MSERDQLLAILRKVRRRLRGLAALQGAVLGLGAALLASAAWIAVARWRGPVGRPVVGLALLTVIGVGLLGAGLATVRRVPLQRCARALDRLWAGSDRMLSALAFLEQTPTAFTRAAIKDAVDRAQVVAPAHVAPLRRPRGVAALGLGAGIAVAAAFVPFPRHDGRAAAKGTTGAAAVSARVAVAAPLRASDLEAERQEARAAEEAAKALGDPTLEAAAAALARTIAELTAAGAGRGEALDRLAALQERSEQAARDAEALAAGLRRAGQAMESTKETRALADGLTTGNPAATAESAGELAARAERSTATGHEALARALERAAEQAGREAGGGSGSNGSSSGSKSGDQRRAAGAGGGEEDSQRRLQRESSAQDQTGGDDSGAENGSGERRLQRLERDLRDTASACRDNPAACQQQLRERARSLPKMQQESRGAEARRHLARAVQQLRERLQRQGQSGDPSEKQRQRQEQRRFARAASGQRGTAGGSRSAGNGGGDQGEENGDNGDNDKNGENGENGESGENGGGNGDEMTDDSSGGGNGRSGTPSGPAAGDSTGGGARGENGDGRGEGSSEQAAEGGNGGGIGNEGGGQALGRQKDLRAARGKEREAAVRSAAGPKRSSVIQSAAARGFAHGDYRRVYQDYDAVMEESLDATAVPPGQRYLVRRYFQLIRPRSATATTTARQKTTTQPGGPPP